jgi:2-C-methyl-D-erythritol 4-phosphate cytidylyltransferase
MAAARFWAVVPAAGRGSRMGAAIPKQYLPLLGRPLLAHTLLRLARHPDIAGVAVGIAASDPAWPGIEGQIPKLVCTAPGGPERARTVLNTLQALRAHAAEDDRVLVHDAVRPCLRHTDIDRLIAAASGHPDGGLLAIPVADTLKRADAERHVVSTVDRRQLWRALTPQLFPLGLLCHALEQAIAAGSEITDEAMAIERLGRHPLLVEGRSDNIKVTRPEDLMLAELFLRREETDIRA